MESNLNGQRIFITGATGGFGKIAAIYAANKGAKVIALARNKGKGEALVADYKSQYSNGLGSIEIVIGDLSSLESVRKACEEIKVRYTALDMVVHNAGVMNFERKESENHIEETLQVNLLSPLLISHYLIDLLSVSEAVQKG